MIKVQIMPVAHNSFNRGCFWLAGPIIERDAPFFGPAIKQFYVEPHFDDVENAVIGGEDSFQIYRGNLKNLPKFRFSRANKNLTIRYLSNVCLGKDLREAEMMKPGTLPENQSAHLLRVFYLELIEALGGIRKIIKRTDDYDVAGFLSWVSSRSDTLPADNAALYEFFSNQLVEKFSPPDLKDALAMSEKEFWDIIQFVNLDAMEEEYQTDAVEPVIRQLATLPVATIKSFHNHLSNMLFKLDTRKHFEAAEAAFEYLSVDSFLYLRCYIVGRGRQYYESVLQNPHKMPENDVSFERLISAASTAWAEVTDDEPMNFDRNCAENSFETGSNRTGWIKRQ